MTDDVQPVSLGRIVHVVLAGGAVRPAIVAQVWSPTTCNVQVVTDGENDRAALLEMGCAMAPVVDTAPNLAWLTSVPYAAPGDAQDPPAVRTWHWPERRALLAQASAPPLVIDVADQLARIEAALTEQSQLAQALTGRLALVEEAITEPTPEHPLP